MFTRAVRSQSKFKLALTGPSGAGKTLSALKFARGLVGPEGKIAVADTENGSASLYADRYEFDTVEITPPYTPEKFINIIQAAVAYKYDVLILDSISHAWSGEGGVLDQKDKLDAKGNSNGFANWKKLTPVQERFVAAILPSKIHLIATMRSKTSYILVENDKGKQQPKKVGMAPIQRDGMEYEFTSVFDLSADHEVDVSKDRTGLFDGQTFTISENHGTMAREWIAGGAPVIDKPPAEKSNQGNPGAKNGASWPKFTMPIGKRAGTHFSNLTDDELSKALDYVNGLQHPSADHRRLGGEIEEWLMEKSAKEKQDAKKEAGPQQEPDGHVRGGSEQDVGSPDGTHSGHIHEPDQMEGNSGGES